MEQSLLSYLVQSALSFICIAFVLGYFIAQVLLYGYWHSCDLMGCFGNDVAIFYHADFVESVLVIPGAMPQDCAMYLGSSIFSFYGYS